MSKLKRTLAVLLAAVMILGMLPVMTSAAIDDQPIWPNEGAISLSKEAAPIGDSGEYEITLKIEGKNYKTTSDVVLVIDNSNSMYDSDKNGVQRITNTKIAANAFVDQLLTQGSQTRIALVVYGTDVQQTTGFYSAEQKQTLKDAISGISQNEDSGGTNQQAGLHAARELLATSSGKMKNIVILSDGEPTYSYPFAVPSYGNVPANPTPDYDTRIGCGYHFKIGEDIFLLGHQDSGNAGYNFLGFRSRGSYTYKNDGTFTFEGGANTNNGVATIWEANQAKAEGITIFSVALQAGTNGENTLKDCATDNSCYYAISNSETDVPGKLTQAFTAIAGKIAIAASDGAVTDPMSEYVAMVIEAGDPVITSDIPVYSAGNADIYISQGTASWDSTNETISWSVGNISEGTPAIMKYKVIVTDNTLRKGAVIPTNGTTTFSYKNYLGNNTSKDFDIPKITLQAGSIKVHYYAVNSEGTPVNAEGHAVDTPYHAQEIKTAIDFVYSDSSVLDYGTYTVESAPIDDYRCMGYTLDKDNRVLTQTTSVDVSVSAAAPNQEVWFAYVPQFKVVHVYSDGADSKTENYDVVSNFNLTETVGKNYLYAGTFNSAACDNVYPFTRSENGLSFTPVKGATYYVKEVPNNYLTPKSVCVWKHVSETDVDVTNFYVLTAVDNLKYREVGFDVTYNTNSADAPIRDIGATNADEPVNNKVYKKVVSKLFNGIEREITLANFKVSDDSYFACHEVPSVYWQKAGDQITFHPYWITLDGVKVSGALERTCQYNGSGSDSGGYITYDGVEKFDAEKYKKVGKIKDQECKSPMVSVLTESAPVPALFSLRAAPTTIIGNNNPVDPVIPDPDPVIPDPKPDNPTECIVTVHDGDNIYVEKVELGGDLELGYEGSLFAGWFTDPSFENPADLSNIQSDIEVWAKYVSDDYLCTKYIEQGWFKVYGMTLISALDSDNYADAGFIINGDIISCDYSSSYGAFTARALFGSEISRGAKLMTYSLSLRKAKNGDKFVVTPYWVTLDGTTVYGTERTFTYNSRGIVG